MKLLSQIETHFDGKTSVIARDLKLNLKRIIEGTSFEEKEKSLLVLTLSHSLGLSSLAGAAKEDAMANAFSEDQIQEAIETAALMDMLNNYYRFKDFLKEENPTIVEQYKNTGLRMNVFTSTKLGKALLEALALAHSIVNGCKYCTAAHEKVLRESGWSVDKIHDVARLSAVLKGISKL